MALIECACGCGELREDRDKQGKARRFIKGHQKRTKVKRICEQCGTEFETIPAVIKNGGGKFCSKECSGKSKRTKVKRKCEQCGTEFEIAPSDIKRGRGKFCSKECYGKSKITKVKWICEQCGTEFEITPSVIKKGGGKFCSKECHDKSKITKVKQICEQCGTEFEITPSVIKKGGGKLCSKECYGKWKSGENNPNWQGGISFEPYCQKFDEKFKEYIRDKYDRTCFLCPTTEPEQIADMKAREKRPFKLSVHHINYNKDCLCDDSKCEFVPLCMKCHPKTNHNREYWEARIISKLQNNNL